MITLVSLLPIALYLLVLKILDSFALARWRTLAYCMAYGVLCCALAFALTSDAVLGLSPVVGGVSVMPLVEEILKCIFPFCLVLRRKVRFMAETLIYGAAVGGGFSLLENIIYLYYVPDMMLGTAIVRGFGCAILHIGCTALASTILLLLVSGGTSLVKVPAALIPSVLIHFSYNAALESSRFRPIVMLALTVVLFVSLFVLLFNIGEKKIYRWMDHSISVDVMTRSAIRNGNFSSTKAGEYLLGVKEQFNPEVFFDMICYVELFLELKIEKQSYMLLCQAGFESDELAGRLKQHQSGMDELASLARNIGKTGMSVLAPLIQDKV